MLSDSCGRLYNTNQTLKMYIRHVVRSITAQIIKMNADHSFLIFGQYFKNYKKKMHLYLSYISH